MEHQDVSCSGTTQPNRPNRHAFLRTSVAVAPRWRRRGYARKLLRRMARCFVSLKRLRVRLWTSIVLLSSTQNAVTETTTKNSPSSCCPQRAGRLGADFDGRWCLEARYNVESTSAVFRFSGSGYDPRGTSVAFGRHHVFFMQCSMPISHWKISDVRHVASVRYSGFRAL